MNRRNFLAQLALAYSASTLFRSKSLFAQSEDHNKKQIAITIDDPNLYQTPMFQPAERDLAILAHLEKQKVQAALFVCGERVDNPEGKKLLSRWDASGHLICNHSYSHYYYHSDKIEIKTYLDDIKSNDKLIRSYDNYTKLFRFPYLKEGNTIAKRDSVRKYLSENHYRIGYTTVDASDWYIDQRLKSRLQDNKNADLIPYRDFYLEHILARTEYYSNLSDKVIGHPVRHTLLIHHNLLNALFLGDLIRAFQSSGWEIIDADIAYADPIYQKQPDIIPAGESLIWALAYESGKYKEHLRYPGEDAEYEQERMDQLGL